MNNKKKQLFHENPSCFYSEIVKWQIGRKWMFNHWMFKPIMLRKVKIIICWLVLILSNERKTNCVMPNEKRFNCLVLWNKITIKKRILIFVECKWINIYGTIFVFRNVNEKKKCMNIFGKIIVELIFNAIFLHMLFKFIFTPQTD